MKAATPDAALVGLSPGWLHVFPIRLGS